MSKKTKIALVLLSVLLLIVAVRMVEAWSCEAAYCTGCTLHCDIVEVWNECCGGCWTQWTGWVYCCVGGLGCRYIPMN